MRSLAASSLLLLTVASFAAEGITPRQEEFFERKVRPVLAEHCFKCHGPTKQESELRLDSQPAMARGGASGEKLLSAGAPETSLLVKAIRHDGDVKMPPETKMPDEQIAAISEWVRDGAPWPKSSAAESLSLTASERVQPHRENHWAYQPITAPPLPNVQNTKWLSTRTDSYVLSNLEAKGLAPSAPVDRRTLVRRLTFDLLGLPPTMEEVDSFVADNSPDAYDRLVDRLLASPHYGERWGRHWLDVARYADSRGYAFENDRRYPYAYTYRDYVVESFNRDLPYDRFVTEQLAADRLDLGTDRRPLAALGFITVGRKYLAIQDTYDDQIDVVTRGLLGLTVACARCHDHKFDAVPTDDYYSLYGVFASCDEPGTSDLPLIGEASQVAGYEQFERELKKLRGELDEYRNKTGQEILETARAKVTDYLVRVATRKDDLLAKLSFLSLKPEEIRRKIVENWTNFLRDRARPEHPTLGLWAEIVALPDDGFAEKSAAILDAWKKRERGFAAGQVNPFLRDAIENFTFTQKADVAKLYGDLLTKSHEAWKAGGANDEALQKLSEEQRQFANFIVGKDAPTQIPMDKIVEVFNRAEKNRYREIEKKIQIHEANSSAAPPRAMVVKERDRPFDPHVFTRGDANRPGRAVARQFPVVLTGNERKPFAQGSGRLELAQSIVSPTNPLTARVLANRVWMHHFGEPLVDSPSDFGIRTPRPVQSALLDHLASFLLEHSWSIKDLHREIVLSSTFQQQSLDRKDCQAADPENRLLWKMNRRRLEWESLRDAMLAASGRLDHSLSGRSVEISKPPFSARRTVYANIDRQDLPNLFRSFDIASPDASNPRRARTTIPQQSLFLMNSPFSIEQGKQLAARPEMTSTLDENARLAALYHAALARDPSPEEAAVAKAFLATATTDPAGAQLSPWEQLGQLLLMTNEFAYVD